MFNVKDDVRIEIMQALLNQSIVSPKAFDAIADIFDSVSGDSDDAWAEYKALFGSSSASSAN